MTILQITKALFILYILTVLSSCSSSDGTSSDADSGRVSILLTDGPTDDFDQINITLESISFLSDSDAPEVILFEETRVINLLALQNYSDWLSTTVVPVGTYSKIRLLVSQVELVKLDSNGTILESNIAKLPANGKIDLNPRSSFEVVGDTNLMIELDMDANKSIHVVETGNGKFIFRPVIFVNILGEEELKLVMLDGKILARAESGFQLCDAELIQADDSCLEVLITDNTVVQDKQIDLAGPVILTDNTFVTVLGKASSENINALHIILVTEENDGLDQALFTGNATSSVVDTSFDVETDDDNDVVSPGAVLAVELATGARIFDKYGAVIANDAVISGSDVDVFGLALPDLITIDAVKAAFVIADNDVDDEKISGDIVAINTTESEITVTVISDVFSGDMCVNLENAELFLLSIVDVSISSEEITISELQLGQVVDVYSDDIDDDDGCLSADVVLVSEN